jgi:thiol-disulfide isomerase/thioredoxin
MKRITPVLLIILLLSCKDKGTDPFVTGMEKKPLPDLGILLPDSASYFNTSNIAAGKKVILFFYSPTCPHCRAQMREILKHINQYKDHQLCVLTWSDFPAMKEFNTYFNLQKYPNIITGIDTGFVVPRIYGITAVPFMAAFDKDKRLKSAYLGRMSSKTLLKAANL